jgi:hypothetical protein
LRKNMSRIDDEHEDDAGRAPEDIRKMMSSYQKGTTRGRFDAELMTETDPPAARPAQPVDEARPGEARPGEARPGEARPGAENGPPANGRSPSENGAHTATPTGQHSGDR